MNDNLKITDGHFSFGEHGIPVGRTLNEFAERSRLLKDARPMSEIGITSLKQVTWEHQRAAMAAGYNGVTDMAVDELLAQVQELRARVDELERRPQQAVYNGD